MAASKEHRARKKRVEAWIETAIDLAKQHGEDTEPDHEVGDLQDLARAMWRELAPAGRGAVIRGFTAWNAPECPKCRALLRMCAAADPACMHCDACDWAGDPATTKRRSAAQGSSPPTSESEARERADMRIYLVMNKGAPDQVECTLASLLREDDSIREDDDLVREFRALPIGGMIEGGGGAAAEWTAHRIPTPNMNGEEVTCDAYVMLRGTRHWIAVREGIASVHGTIGRFDNRIAAYTWQGDLVDCIEGEGILSLPEERKIAAAIKEAWAAERARDAASDGNKRKRRP